MTLDQSTMPPKSTDKKAKKGNVFIDNKRASAARKPEQEEAREDNDEDEEEEQPKSRKQSKPEGIEKIG